MLKGLRGAWLRGTSDPLQAALGPLERAVMDTMWRGGGLSVREVQAQLGNPAAYTTVMTTLDRLYKKGLVQRKRDGRAFLYSAALERHELETSMTTGLLNGMLSSGPGATRPFLSNLVDAVGDSDNALLDELERLVRDKRERLKDKRAQGRRARCKDVTEWTRTRHEAAAVEPVSRPGVVRGGQCGGLADRVDGWRLDARAIQDAAAAPRRRRHAVDGAAAAMPWPRRSSCWPCSCPRTGASSLPTRTNRSASCSAALPQWGSRWRSRGAWRAAAGGPRRSPLRRSDAACGQSVEATSSGAFEIGGLPGVSLAGIWRPRILIGSEALSALTPAELDVAISHEVAHQRSQDNLKRFLMFCAPDLFGWTRVARQLEERWQAEAECEADAPP